MKIIAAVLLMFIPSLSGAQETAPTPVPRGTPFNMEFFFTRPARIFSWAEAEGAGAWKKDTDYIITEERPFLTQKGFSRAHWIIQEGKPMIRVKLNDLGNAHMDEAVLGNIGRTIVLVWNNKIRGTFEMRHRFHPNDIVIYGNLSNAEAEQITQMINYRPSPSPSPQPTPTPEPTPKDSVLSIF